jgi:hypothetical protein
MKSSPFRTGWRAESVFRPPQRGWLGRYFNATSLRSDWGARSPGSSLQFKHTRIGTILHCDQPPTYYCDAILAHAGSHRLRLSGCSGDRTLILAH